MGRFKTRIIAIFAALMLGLGGLALTATPSEAITAIFKVSTRSKKPLVVYEKFNCKGDSDGVWPGEKENSKKVKVVSSAWVAYGTGAMFNNIPKKAKWAKGKCVNIYGPYMTVIADTW